MSKSRRIIDRPKAKQVFTSLYIEFEVCWGTFYGARGTDEYVGPAAPGSMSCYRQRPGSHPIISA